MCTTWITVHAYSLLTCMLTISNAEDKPTTRSHVCQESQITKRPLIITEITGYDRLNRQLQRTTWVRIQLISALIVIFQYFVIPNCNYINLPFGSKISNHLSFLHPFPALSVRRAMRGNKSSCCIVFFLFIFSSFQGKSHGKTMKQTDALDNIQKAKLRGSSGIDTSTFEVSAVETGAENNKILPEKGSKESDRIEKLPGQPEVEFHQYGGYVTIDKSKGKALYYYFAEALTGNQSLPLLLWLNGGTYFPEKIF